MTDSGSRTTNVFTPLKLKSYKVVDTYIWHGSVTNMVKQLLTTKANCCTQTFTSVLNKVNKFFFSLTARAPLVNACSSIKQVAYDRLFFFF